MVRLLLRPEIYGIDLLTSFAHPMVDFIQATPATPKPKTRPSSGQNWLSFQILGLDRPNHTPLLAVQNTANSCVE